ILSCGHSPCGDCAREVILLAVAEEGRFPPRCCNEPYSRELIRHLLGDDGYRAYKEKEREYKSISRVYCAVPTCSAFIPDDKVDVEYATCPKCDTKTHLPCCAVEHPWTDCSPDPALRAAVALAQESKWRRCHHCRMMVEKTGDGCRFVTCRCGKVFCYSCGGP
ncbi:uncharacterized protein BO97DRAFT_305013, partial [Aspergillus homomorphus CBS 101889]